MGNITFPNNTSVYVSSSSIESRSYSNAVSDLIKGKGAQNLSFELKKAEPKTFVPSIEHQMNKNINLELQITQNEALTRNLLEIFWLRKY